MALANPSRIEKGGFRWLYSGRGGFRKRIQRATIVTLQTIDILKFTEMASAMWLPPGFPGEAACR
jgi:hypothetical protein